MPYDMDQVAERLSGAVESFTRRCVAHRLGIVEWRVARQSVHTGRPQLAVKALNEAILELSGRVDALERNNTRETSLPATPEQRAKWEREWEVDFPGSKAPTVWQVERK